MNYGARHLRTWSVTMVLAIAVLPRVALANGDVSPEARAHFKAGVSYLEDPEGQRFEDAFAEFKKAYELSHSPKILGNLGLCAMKLERDGEAIDDYTRYLADVPDIDPAEKTQITRDVQTLSASVVTATVTTSVPSAVIVDTRVPVRGPSVTNVYDVATFASVGATLWIGNSQPRRPSSSRIASSPRRSLQLARAMGASLHRS
jgi:tetratricopeptide (TPR) repeat protein